MCKSIVQANEKGFIGVSHIQAQIINNIEFINSEKITISGNTKTGEIPCINLPNITLQAELLNLVKRYPELLKNDRLDTIVKYMEQNTMCLNCAKCSQACYNNSAYRIRPTKAIADLRSLYFMISRNHEFVGQVVQRTRNLKIVRLNGSGEIHNDLILNTYIKIAKENPTTIYYTYTKNFNILVGKKLPKNLIVNISDFGANIDMSIYNKNVNCFKTVSEKEFNDTKETSKVKKCLGNCTACNYCYTKKGYTILCKIHGQDSNKVEL